MHTAVGWHWLPSLTRDLRSNLAVMHSLVSLREGQARPGLDLQQHAIDEPQLEQEGSPVPRIPSRSATVMPSPAQGEAVIKCPSPLNVLKRYMRSQLLLSTCR